MFKQHFKAFECTKFYISLDDNLCNCLTWLLSIHCIFCLEVQCNQAAEPKVYLFLTSVFCNCMTTPRRGDCTFPEELQGKQKAQRSHEPPSGVKSRMLLRKPCAAIKRDLERLENWEKKYLRKIMKYNESKCRILHLSKNNI